MKRKLLLLIVALVVGLLPGAVGWDVPTAQAAVDAGRTGTTSLTAGIEFRVRQEDGGYVVSMRPNADPAGDGKVLTSQVTVLVPHATGGDRFEVSNLTSLVDRVYWNQPSRVDAPVEAPGIDYVSFEFDYFFSDFGAITWQAGQEVDVFRFENSGSFQGAVSLMADCDQFNTPNSMNTNPANQIAVRGYDIDNAYLGNYGDGSASVCAGQIFLPMVR